MPVVIALTVLIQAFFIIHVFRTGRPYWWAFIILSTPVLGCVVYYFVEVFPGSREHRSADRFARDLARSFDPTKELNRRLEALETSPTAANKVAAAEEYMQCGGFDKAAELYESALDGVHASDPDLLLGLAGAQLELGTCREALRTLDRLAAVDPAFRRNEAALLRARAHELLGENDQAIAIYEPLVEVFVGLEARYRYATLLGRLGHQQQSLATFRALLDHARRHSVSLEAERRWVEGARRAVAV
ncbi:MAG: tetratricopeptide repeat protein [Burkholderiales bacterium]|jgi:hypothetical protein|nr:tetratricopeptide repeat protein [Burkholderiales bacterium]